MKSANRI